MAEFGVYEAKTHLTKLLALVEKGEEVTITRHGVPVARLVPYRERERRLTPQEAAEKLRAFRDAHPLKGITTRQLIEDGRKR